VSFATHVDGDDNIDIRNITAVHALGFDADWMHNSVRLIGEVLRRRDRSRDHCKHEREYCHMKALHGVFP
jgi:hypothetical protein